MSDPALIKTLSTAHSHLLSAARYITTEWPASVPAHYVALADVESKLSTEELREFLDLLAEQGLKQLPRAGFWRDLERAAEVLASPDRMASCRAQFKVTLSRKSECAEGDAK